MGTETATTDDYVQRGEFHLLCSYLLIYVGLFDAFACIDGGSAGTTAEDDRRISPEEWAAHHSKLSEHAQIFVGLANIDESNQDAVFAAMDGDGKGMVVLKEWCEFLKGKEQEAGTAMGRVLSVGDALALVERTTLDWETELCVVWVDIKPHHPWLHKQSGSI